MLLALILVIAWIGAPLSTDTGFPPISAQRTSIARDLNYVKQLYVHTYEFHSTQRRQPKNVEELLRSLEPEISRKLRRSDRFKRLRYVRGVRPSEITDKKSNLAIFFMLTKNGTFYAVALADGEGLVCELSELDQYLVRND